VARERGDLGPAAPVELLDDRGEDVGLAAIIREMKRQVIV